MAACNQTGVVSEIAVFVSRSLICSLGERCFYPLGWICIQLHSEVQTATTILCRSSSHTTHTHAHRHTHFYCPAGVSRRYKQKAWVLMNEGVEGRSIEERDGLM